jgi:hypothetical protein
MTKISIEPARKTVDVLPLIRSAVDSEIARLKLALNMAMKRLLPFEEKYGVTSEYFITEMAAEDLAGKDEEYIRWAGEYRLMQRLQEKLQKLQEVDYDDSGILTSPVIISISGTSSPDGQSGCHSDQEMQYQPRTPFLQAGRPLTLCRIGLMREALG